MTKINSFRELIVWQKSMRLAERCYRLTQEFSSANQQVLGREIRKSCVSIPSNIAEGFGRYHTAEYLHHLDYANGSGNELQTQLEIGMRIQIVNAETAEALISDAEEVGRMLNGLIQSLEQANPNARPRR